MRTLAHFYFAAGFAALAGCAQMGIQTPPPHTLPVNCKAGDCTVTVTVTGCGRNQYRVDREPLVVDRQYNGPIHWDLATSGYSFAANGIDIKQGNDAEFDGKDHKPKKFKWNNKHSNYKTYKYDINLVRDGQTGVCTYDPSIMN